MKKIIFERKKHCFSENLFQREEKSFLYKTKEELPKKIVLEACSLCQLNCAACWLRSWDDVFEKEKSLGYLKFNDFKNLVDDNPQLEQIELSNNGEIFLNPELGEIIKYAYQKGVKLTAYGGVNLNTLSDEMAENLVKYQFMAMEVSIDGATPESYKIYRRGGDFNRVISNVKKINEFKKKYDSKYPQMTYKFIIFNHNIEDIPLAKKLANELDMDLKFDQNNQPKYAPLSEEQIVRAEDLSGITFQQTGEKHIFKEFQKGNRPWFFCQDLFEAPRIDWNGKLFGCCRAFACEKCLNKTYNINVFKQGLFKALNNAKVLYAKRMLTDFSVPPKDDILCTYCSVYKLLREENYEMYSDRKLN